MVAAPPTLCYADIMMTRMRHLRWTAVLAGTGVAVGLLGGLLVVSSALFGCGKQDVQGCSPPSLTNAPPTLSASNVGSIGQIQGGGATVGTTVRPTLTFNQPMNPATLTTATILLQRCDGAQGQQGGGCSASSPVAGSVTYDACTATAMFTPAQSLAAGTEHVLGVPACTSSDALCSTQTLARDTSGRPLATGAGGLCGSLPTNVFCVTFTTSGGVF